MPGVRWESRKVKAESDSSVDAVLQYGVYDTANFALSATATYVVTPPQPPMRTGCPTVPTQPVAPGGYYVNGNTICTGDGRAHLLHGVDRRRSSGPAPA
jgi:hypothetical protein